MNEKPASPPKQEPPESENEKLRRENERLRNAFDLGRRFDEEMRAHRANLGW